MSINLLRKTEAKKSRHTHKSFLNSLDLGSATLIRNLKKRIKEWAAMNRSLQMMILMLFFNKWSATFINSNQKRASTKRDLHFLDLQNIWWSIRTKWIIFHNGSSRLVVSSKSWTSFCSKNYLWRKSRIQLRDCWGSSLISTRTIKWLQNLKDWITWYPLWYNLQTSFKLWTSLVELK